MNRAPFLGIAHPHTHLRHARAEAMALIVDGRVARQHYDDFMSELDEGLREGSDDIGEATRFGERDALGSYHHNVHGSWMVMGLSADYLLLEMSYARLFFCRWSGEARIVAGICVLTVAE